MREKDKSRAFLPMIKRFVIVWSIFSLGLLLTILLSYKEYYNERLNLVNRFQTKVDDHINLIQQHLLMAIHDFEGLKKFYPENSLNFDYKNFELYAENVCSFNKAVWAIGWLPKVTAKEMPDFIIKANQWQKEKQITFRVWKLSSDKKRDFNIDKKFEYYPILYFYPLNTEVIGFDESSQIDRNNALQRVLSTGSSSVSKLIELIPQVYEAKELKDKDRSTKALLMFIPVFSTETSSVSPKNSSIKGLILGIIKLDTLLAQSLKSLDSIGIDLNIYQVQEGQKAFIQEIKAKKPIFQRMLILKHDFKLFKEAEIKFLDSNIVIEFRASQSFYYQNTNDIEVFILFFGFSLSLLLALFINRKLTYTRDIEEKVSSRTSELLKANQNLIEANEEITATNEELQSISEELNMAHNELLENEIELRRNLKLLETIISKSPMLIMIYNKKEKTWTCNEQFSNVFSWNKDDFSKDTDPLSKMLVKEEEIAIFKHLIENPDSQFREARFKTKNKKMLDQRWANFEIDDEVVISIGFDITQEKDLFEHMMSEQKEQNLTMLAGGIAHDFNNILVGVLNGAELLLNDLPEDQKSARELVRIIYHSALRMTELTQQMLAYAKGGKYNPKPANINNLLLEAINLTKGVRKSEVNIDIFLDPEIRSIYADHSQIHQVLINLLVNASEAIPIQGGNIKIITKNISSLNEISKIEIKESNPFGWVMITVEDTGAGISDENLDKIFDPFFSTKFVGRGLGLAAVKGIIENHKGIIRVESNIGKGTKFMIAIPASSDQPAIFIDNNDSNFDSLADNHITPPKKEFFVLLVEDEPIVRDLIIRILQRLKLQVIFVETGEDAIELFRNRMNEIELVILDMQLPGISGSTTYNMISELKHDVKALFCSGYSQQQIMIDIKDDRKVHFIQKPFLPNTLMERLIEMEIISDKVHN